METLKRDLWTSCCLLLSRCGCGGEALAPLQPGPPSEPSGATGAAHPGSKVHPQFASPIRHQPPGSAAPLEATAITTITTAPLKTRKYPNRRAVWDSRIAKTIPTPPQRVCVHGGEGAWGGGREGTRQREGREGGRRESKLWETPLHLSHSTGAEQGAGRCLTTRSTPITALIMMGMIILPVVLMKRKNSPDRHTGKKKFFQVPPSPGEVSELWDGGMTALGGALELPRCAQRVWPQRGHHRRRISAPLRAWGGHGLFPPCGVTATPARCWATRSQMVPSDLQEPQEKGN